MDESALADRVRELLFYNPDTGEFIWRNTRGGRCDEGYMIGIPSAGYRGGGNLNLAIPIDTIYKFLEDSPYEQGERQDSGQGSR